MMNKVFLMGRLTKDVKSKCCTISTSSYANFTLAVEDHSFIEKDGKHHVDYISCYAVGKMAEVIDQAVIKKGQMITVSGKWRTGSYIKNGQLVYTQQLFIQELFFCGKKEDNTSKQVDSSSRQDKPIKIYRENTKQTEINAFNVEEELAKIRKQHISKQAKAN